MEDKKAGKRIVREDIKRQDSKTEARMERRRKSELIQLRLRLVSSAGKW